MITFNVGPSRVSSETKEDVGNAVREGVLEISHRSEEFSEISKEAICGMREFFKLPEEYRIFYTSSATNAMQLSVGNCCEEKSFHFVNGNFSELFSKVAKSLGKKTVVDKVGPGELNDFSSAKIDSDVDFISVTHNETSTGVMCSLEEIQKLHKSNSNAVLAVDITSSAGAVDFDFNVADIWFFSVQKCFGLPAGLGVIFVSPKAFERSIELSRKGLNLAGLFSFENKWKKMGEKYQTILTPNVLGIYLLAKKMTNFLNSGGISKIESERDEKFKIFEEFVRRNDEIEFFAEDQKNLSRTIFCIKAEEDLIQRIHSGCKKEGLSPGKGYGNLKQKAIRISNFPEIQKRELQKLIEIIEKVLNER